LSRVTSSKPLAQSFPIYPDASLQATAWTKQSTTPEKLSVWLETVIDDGGTVPEPGTIAVHQANPEFAGWAWAVVAVDLAKLSDKAERVNITLPARVLRRIDSAAKAAGESRSGYIAHLALRA
jgi:hypothetical protein